MWKSIIAFFIGTFFGTTILTDVWHYIQSHATALAQQHATTLLKTATAVVQTLR